MTMLKLFTCIVFFNPDSGRSPAKYRNVNNLERFELFAKKKGGVYFNIYVKSDKSYLGRKYLNV